MRQFEIISYGEKDLEKFRDYIASAFHKKYILADPNYLNWQYGGSLFVAKADDKIVGHFGYRDIRYKVFDKSKFLRVLMNFNVLKEYRIAGIGTLLARAVFDTTNPILVSGYRPGAFRLFGRLRPNFRAAGDLLRYLFLINFNHSLFEGYKKRISDKLISDDRWEIVDEPVYREVLGKLWTKARDFYPTTVERTGNYLSWRFFNNPLLKYFVFSAKYGNETKGYVVLRVEEDQGFKIFRIVDLVATEEKTAATLLGAVIQAGRKAKAHAVDFFVSGSIYQKALSKVGFFEASQNGFENFPALFNPISVKKLFINIAYDLKVELSQCYLTKADGDQDRANPR